MTDTPGSAPARPPDEPGVESSEERGSSPDPARSTGEPPGPGEDAASAEPGTRPAPAPQRRRSRIPLGVDLLIALVIIALVQTFLVKPFGVPSQSMETTLDIGDRIVVNRLDHSLVRGEVVVFGHGETWTQPRLPADPSLLREALLTFGDLTGIGPSHTAYTVKRVIGLPGEKVACCTRDGKVTVDGTPLTEPYVYQDLRFTTGGLDCSTAEISLRCFGPVTVPPGNILVMGDHRSQSADSVLDCRGSPKPVSGCARFVPEERIIGPVVLRIWPLGRLGGL